MKKYEIQKPLSSENIDYVSDCIVDFLTSCKLISGEIQRIRLCCEEVLLAWQEEFGKDISFSCITRKNLGQPQICLFLENGKQFNPINNSDDFGPWTQSLMAKLQTMPTYTYRRGINSVVFNVKTPNRPFMLLLWAIVAATVVGVCGNLFFSDELQNTITDNFLTPLSSTYLNILGLFGIPLIAISMTTGVLGIGDLNTFTSIGKKLVRNIFLMLIMFIALTFFLAFPFFSMTYASENIGFNYTEILSMFWGFIPTNLFSPFIEGQGMQLILMGVVFGIALLKLGNKVSSFTSLLFDFNNILILASEWFTRFIPAFVFITITKTFWMGQLDTMVSVWRTFVITTVFQLMVIAIQVIYIRVTCRVEIKLVLKKIYPTFLVALSTNSFSISLSEGYSCVAKLGVNNKMSNFGIPISTSLFKPATAIRLLVLSFYMAEVYSVGISFSWGLLAVLMAMILSFSIPTMPGGVLMFSAMLFTQLGIPVEAQASMLATDVFFDSVCTAINLVSVELQLTQFSESLGMLDKEILKKG